MFMVNFNGKIKAMKWFTVGMPIDRHDRVLFLVLTSYPGCVRNGTSISKHDTHFESVDASSQWCFILEIFFYFSYRALFR